MMKKYNFLYVIVICGMVVCCSNFPQESSQTAFPEKIDLDIFDESSGALPDHFHFLDKKSIYFPDSVQHAFSKAANLIFTDNYILTIDQMSSNIHLFDDSGTYISNAGGKGRGPGEYSFLQNWTYHKNTLYLYDGGLKKFSSLGIPGLQVENECTIDTRISGFTVTDGGIVALTPPSLDGGGMISLLDPTNCSTIDRIHAPADLNASIYLARSNAGDIAKIDDHTVVTLYPNQHYLHSYEISDETILPKTEYRFGNMYNTFRPDIQPFPENLNPFGSSEEHTLWYESQSRLHWLYVIQPDVITMVGSAYTEDDRAAYFMNAYLANGDVLFEGLDLRSDSLSLPATSAGPTLVFSVEYDDAERNEFEFYVAEKNE